MCSNPRNLAFTMDKITYLHKSASATMFFFHYLYLITYRRISINLTYLASLLLSLPCPFKCFNDL